MNKLDITYFCHFFQLPVLVVSEREQIRLFFINEHERLSTRTTYLSILGNEICTKHIVMHVTVNYKLVWIIMIVSFVYFYFHFSVIIMIMLFSSKHENESSYHCEKNIRNMPDDLQFHVRHHYHLREKTQLLHYTEVCNFRDRG